MAATPLVHLTLPDITDPSGEGDPAHFAPFQILLEAMCRINEWHIARANKKAAKGEGVPLPPLYASGVRYREDPPGHEDWRDIYQVYARGFGDCLPLDTLVLRDDYELVPLISLRPGDRIMGDGAWTQVLEHCVTGEKPILAIETSNGCVLRCSPDHRLFRDVNGTIEEIRASDVRVGDDLVTPRSIPLAETDEIRWPDQLSALSIEDRAWLLGVFVADGWTEESRFAISGLDGDIKEDQKRRVAALMAIVGASTRWHTKYISVNDRPLAAFFAQCGHTAPQKHLDSIRFSTEAAVRAVIDGLSADAGRAKTGDSESSLVYGTTSYVLALQLRILHRMISKSVSIRRVDDHGGFGKHPIYRVIPREKIAPGTTERRDKKFARVRSISDDGIETCGDIKTDSGRFWLPESDVLVHNCDNVVGIRVGELRVAGIPCEPVLKWQWVPREVMIKLYGAKATQKMIGSGPGVWMVHCLVRYLDGRLNDIEDPSKILGMGGTFTSKV